ncbi:hypothetical protein DAMA08_005470 [Martiniozyma asiatica (nom. inval.)]|nr:hypothetical protein DAMA08_005470 [Martiniozyma asiatica]
MASKLPRLPRVAVKFKNTKNDLQRTETLGDSVLQHTVTKFLFDAYPKASAGQLSMLRQQLVQNETLIKWGSLYKLDKILNVPLLENEIGSRFHANLFESYLGILTTDDKVTFDVLQNWINSLCKYTLDVGIVSNDKIKEISRRTEWDRLAWNRLISIIDKKNVMLEVTFVQNDLLFLCGITADNELIGVGIGSSQREAKARASIDAMMGCAENFTKKGSWDAWVKRRQYFIDYLQWDNLKNILIEKNVKIERYCSWRDSAVKETQSTL